MSYLERLKKVTSLPPGTDNTAKSPVSLERCEPEKKLSTSLYGTDNTDRTNESSEIDPSDRFDSAPQRDSNFFFRDSHAQALAILQRLYAEHEQRLIAGGHDGKGALVHGMTWTQALKKARIPPDVRFDLLDAGKVSLQGPYWYLVDEVTP